MAGRGVARLGGCRVVPDVLRTPLRRAPSRQVCLRRRRHRSPCCRRRRAAVLRHARRPVVHSDDRPRTVVAVGSRPALLARAGPVPVTGATHDQRGRRTSSVVGMSDAPAVELPPPPPRDAGAAVVAAAELLWPAPAQVEVTHRRAKVGPGRRVVREQLLAPDAAHPRLVTPANAHRAGAAIASRRNGSGGLLGRVAGRSAAALVRMGAADRLVSARLRVTAPADAQLDDIETKLSELLGTRVIVGLHVGTARVNRKPVLHTVDEEGRTLAFVKVGHNDAARALVRAEAETLRALAESTLATVQVPAVLAFTAWRDTELLVLSPLTGRPVRPALRNLPLQAMRELSNVRDTTTQPLAAGAFLARIGQLADQLRAETADRYQAALQTLRGVDVATTFGVWHGDWHTFNMARLRADRVAVWDWERFSAGVPVGFDALHFLLQVLLQERGVGPQVADQFLTQAEELVVRAGALRPSARAVVASYVAEIGGRYLALAEGPDGELLARRAHWTLGLLESCVARL